VDHGVFTAIGMATTLPQSGHGRRSHLSADRGTPVSGLKKRLVCPAADATVKSMGSITWGEDIAAVYDTVYAAERSADVLEPMIEELTRLSAHGSALELAVGTGRVALALSERGVPVHGIELSPHMARQLRRKPGADRVPVTVGDMTTVRLPRSFRLVYLVANTIMNVTTQEEQEEVFRTAAAHLEPGGRFLLEVVVPQPPSAGRGEKSRVFTHEPEHLGIETFDDPVAQIAWSHHWMQVGGRLIKHSAPYRYVWPSELDLMAKLAGLRLQHRWANWHRAPFRADSPAHVSVYVKPTARAATVVRG
jgi:SAM-dependent methyltransferase